MPSVYDYRHVELDKVGRGKRVIQAPGGASSNIFSSGVSNGVNGGSEGSDLNSIDSGSLSSLPSTPVNGVNGSNGSTNGHFFGDAMSECSNTPPSSASSSRRGSRQEDTKNRLFGPEVESPRRRVVDRMKSNIFSENNGTTNGSVGLVRSASVKKYDHVIRRNPITGEVYDEPNPKLNGHNGTNGINGKVNGVNNSGSASLPTTPVRVRQPPGGKCSGIFS